MAHDTSDEFPIIYRYSRKDAIEDGVLVDVSEHAKEIGYKIPVAITNNAWADGIAWRGDVSFEQSRLRRLLLEGLLAVKNNSDETAGDTLIFSVNVLRLEDFLLDKNAKPVSVEFKLHIGGGDNGEPVLTVLLPDED